MLKDYDIRVELVRYLEKHNEKHDYRLLEELAVCDGVARVDVAVANGKLQGYEIKSDKDTLYRLDKQVECYNKIFDTVTIIVGMKYVDIVSDKIPEWRGIKAAFSGADNTVKFKDIRKGKVNRNVDSLALTQMLWRDELYTLLVSYGLKGLSGKHRRKLREIAVETIPHKELKNHVRSILKTREGWRADLPQK